MRAPALAGEDTRRTNANRTREAHRMTIIVNPEAYAAERLAAIRAAASETHAAICAGSAA